MTVIGFHNSHEQVHPADLLRAVQHAEEVGFTAAMCSDHLEPWNERQGHSGFAWSWLGAALATTNLPFVPRLQVVRAHGGGEAHLLRVPDGLQQSGGVDLLV